MWLWLWGHFNYYLEFRRYRWLEYPIIRLWFRKIIEDVTCESCSALPATNQKWKLHVVLVLGSSYFTFWTVQLYGTAGLHSSWTPQKAYSLHFLLPQQRLLVAMADDHMVQDQSIKLRSSAECRVCRSSKLQTFSSCWQKNGRFVLADASLLPRAWQ